jgi:tetratricopeptide (TPR) repeat protein
MQMFLTHVDEEGNDSPAILVENSTAANRAVNIPEFVNIPPDGLIKIDAPAAIPLWQQALALNPDDDRAQTSLAAALASTGRPAEAIPHFEKAVAANPDYDDAVSGLGAALMATGRLADSIPQYQRALRINPENIEALANLGAALAQTGRLNEAIVQLERAVALDPEYMGAQANLGGALLQKGEPAQAIPHFEKAVVLQPRSAQLRTSLGLALLEADRPDEAIAADPAYVAARESLATTLHHAKGRTAEALAQWRLLLGANPDYVPVLTEAVWALSTSPSAAVRNGTEAVGLADRAARLTGGRDPAVLDAQAAAYAEVGRFADAARVAERAIDLARQQGNATLAVGLDGRLALYRAGKPYRTPSS